MATIFDHIAGGGDPADYALGAAPDADPAPYSGATGSGALDQGLHALVSGAVDGARDAVALPRDVMAGQVDPQSDQGIARTLGMASLMGGGLPMAEEGAVGVMGGKLATVAKDDPFAAIMAALDAHQPAASAADAGMVDPAAASWRLHHGTADPTWDTFDPAKAGARTSGAEKGAMFMSPREDEAAGYAVGDQGRVMPLDVTPGNTGVYDIGQLLATRDPRFMAASRAEHVGSPGVYDAALSRFDADAAYHEDLKHQLGPDHGLPAYPAASNVLNPQSAAISMARADGRDTAILRGLGESAGGDQVVALRPGFVRSATDGSLVYTGGIPGSAGILPGNALTSVGAPPPDPATFNALLAAGCAT